MGRIKSAMIKRTAQQLHASVEGFNSNFENNKKLLKGVFPYKSMRNQIAGAIVKLAKINKQS